MHARHHQGAFLCLLSYFNTCKKLWFGFNAFLINFNHVVKILSKLQLAIRHEFDLGKGKGKGKGKAVPLQA
jgi:hypothetical protein